VNVVVDTCVWSLALRRSATQLSGPEQSLRGELAELISDGRVQMIGPIRQELLSGIRDEHYYRRVRDYLRAFDDEPLTQEDFEQAASASHVCRAAGVSGSPSDFLICATAVRHRWWIFTTDQDFVSYAQHLPLRLYTGHLPRP
jgi:predicted nucleic acid-binding protein